MIYSLDTFIYEGNLILDGYSEVSIATLKDGYIYEVGNLKDISDGENYAQHTVVLKVNGDLTIKEGVTLTSIKDKNFGGPKGMIIYCTGTIMNSGTISMSRRGGYAKGENVYLYKNSNETYEFVPAIGAIGGEGISKNTKGQWCGNKGFDGNSRETGGGSGGSIFRGTNNNSRSADGSSGTSYSGGVCGGDVSSGNGTGDASCEANSNYGFFRNSVSHTSNGWIKGNTLFAERRRIINYKK